MVDKVFYVSCKNEDRDSFKGLFSTVKKALSFINKDIDSKFYKIINEKSEEYIKSEIKEIGVSIVAFTDNHQKTNTFFDKLLPVSDVYYYIYQVEIQ